MKLFLFSTLALLLLVPIASKADTPTFFTHDFPQPDRAEVIATETPDPNYGPKVEIGATQARKMAGMLRALTWTNPDAECDRPQYQLRFYSGKKLIAAETICFHCGCFKPLKSDLHATEDPIYFDVQTTDAKALAAFLLKLFTSSQ